MLKIKTFFLCFVLLSLSQVESRAEKSLDGDMCSGHQSFSSLVKKANYIAIGEVEKVKLDSVIEGYGVTEPDYHKWAVTVKGLKLIKGKLDKKSIQIEYVTTPAEIVSADSIRNLTENKRYVFFIKEFYRQNTIFYCYYTLNNLPEYQHNGWGIAYSDEVKEKIESILEKNKD